MLKSRLLILPVIFAFAVSSLPTYGSLVWRPGEGWSDENGSEVAASSSSDQLDLGHRLEAKGNHAGALAAYKTLVRRWPLALAAPEAQFKIGKLEEDQADFLNSFKSFQKMIEKYPYSPYFPQALDEQFKIANLYLNGEPQRIWKIPMGPSMEKAVTLFQGVIKNAPYGGNAPQAQFSIGLAHEKEARYMDAVDDYQKLIERYPNSELASNAQYQIGYAWMRSAAKPDYDQSAAQKSIEAFQDFIVKYPDSDKAAQAQENIAKLSRRKTQGSFDIAKFYEGQHNPRAAYIYYNRVLAEDAGSENATIAKKRIQELKPIVEALPGGLNPAVNVASANIPLAPAAVPDLGPAPGNQPPAPSTDPTDTTLPKDPLATPGGVASSPDGASLPAPGATPADGTSTAPMNAPGETPAAGTPPPDAGSPTATTPSSPDATTSSSSTTPPASSNPDSTLPPSTPGYNPAPIAPFTPMSPDASLPPPSSPSTTSPDATAPAPASPDSSAPVTTPAPASPDASAPTTPAAPDSAAPSSPPPATAPAPDTSTVTPAPSQPSVPDSSQPQTTPPQAAK